MPLRRIPSSYDIAQICLNGHVINSEADSSPDRNKKFCDRCGEPTIKACPNCNGFIRGKNRKYPANATGVPRRVRQDFASLRFPVPSFCDNCGKPYPWTEARIRAAKELANGLEGLTLEEKETLKKAIDEIVRDTPQTQVAASRFKRLATKIGAGALNSIRELLVDITSEGVKKLIWGP